MRTPEQIANLRKVLYTFIGAFASIASDEQINGWADSLQNRIDSIPHYWKIKVKLYSDPKSFESIEDEPKIIFGSRLALWGQIQKIMARHPDKIEAIYVHNQDSPLDNYVVKNPIKMESLERRDNDQEPDVPGAASI